MNLSVCPKDSTLEHHSCLLLRRVSAMGDSRMERNMGTGKVQSEKPRAGSGRMIWTERVEVYSEELSPTQR